MLFFRTPTGLINFPKMTAEIENEIDPFSKFQKEVLCDHNFVFDQLVKTRSGDEMETIMEKCTICGIVKPRVN